MAAWSVDKYNGIVGANMGLLHPATEDYAQEAVEAIQAGKVIALPTDTTLYGFACDACSVEVNRICEIKGRKNIIQFAICVGDVKDIERFAVADHLPPGLLNCLLPGPVTVVLSANLSRQPISADIIDFENLWEHCAYIYDGGVLPSGRAGSTVVGLTKLGKYKILRPGSAKEETVAILLRHSLLEDGSAT